MTPTFFENQSDFRNWLAANHSTSTELLVGFNKVGSGRQCITWPESVDQALCYGWIDGVRRRKDDESYSIRFTPRKPNSIWSTINIKKAEELIKNGLMRPAGLAAFQKRTGSRSKIYAYENEPVKLSQEYERTFRSNKKAWKFFSSQAPSYQRVVIHRIMTAKQEKTQLSRLGQAILASEKHERFV